MSGASAGAALGSIVPGVGTAIGGVVGGIVGGLMGLFGKSKKAAEEAARELARVREEAFKAADALVEMGKRLEAMRRAFVDKAVSSMPALFENFANQADHSQSALDRLARLGVANFAALRAAGLSVVDAMAQMAPTLRAAQEAARATGTKLTGPLAELAGFQARIERNRGTVDAVSALNDQLAALRATGSLSQGLADDIAAQAQEQMAQLTAEGFTASQALMLMAPALYQLAQAEAAGTIKVDAATQALIDQAAATGAFAGMSDPMAELVELQKAMLELWIEIAKVLGAAVPAAAQRAAAAIGNIPAPPPVPGGPTAPPGENGPKNPRREYAHGGPVTETGMALVHKGEYVVPKHRMKNFFDRQKELADEQDVPQKHRMKNFFKRQKELKKGQDNSITINLSGVAGTPEAIARAVTEAIERGTVPRLRTAIREANQ
jgi:hypothetical protein